MNGKRTRLHHYPKSEEEWVKTRDRWQQRYSEDSDGLEELQEERKQINKDRFSQTQEFQTRLTEIENIITNVLWNRASEIRSQINEIERPLNRLLRINRDKINIIEQHAEPVKNVLEQLDKSHQYSIIQEHLTNGEKLIGVRVTGIKEKRGDRFYNTIALPYQEGYLFWDTREKEIQGKLMQVGMGSFFSLSGRNDTTVYNVEITPTGLKMKMLTPHRTNSFNRKYHVVTVPWGNITHYDWAPVGKSVPVWDFDDQYWYCGIVHYCDGDHTNPLNMNICGHTVEDNLCLGCLAEYIEPPIPDDIVVLRQL